jgi:hypothetical protein
LKINKRVVFNFEKFLTEMKKNWRRLYSFAELLLLAMPSSDVFNLIRPGEMFTACCVYSVDAITQGLCCAIAGCNEREDARNSPNGNPVFGQQLSTLAMMKSHK